MAEFSTNEVMGHSADRLCAAFGVTRQEQVSATKYLFEGGYRNTLLHLSPPNTCVDGGYRLHVDCLLGSNITL